MVLDITYFAGVIQVHPRVDTRCRNNQQNDEYARRQQKTFYLLDGL